MGAPIIADIDAPPVLELAEPILNFVALAVWAFIEADWQALAFSRRNTRLMSLISALPDTPRSHSLWHR